MNTPYKVIPLKLFLDIVPSSSEDLPRMLLARCADSRNDFLEATREEMAETSFYMF